MFGLDLAKEAQVLHKLTEQTERLVKATIKLNANIERLIDIMQKLQDKSNLT